MRARALGVSCALVAGCRGGACVVTPGCPPQVAAQITVTAAGTNAALHDFTVTINGNTATALRCDGVCLIPGGAGKYVFDVSAPGYSSAQRTITVSSHTRNASVYGPNGFEGKECDCEIVDLQLLSISLTATGS